MTTLKKIMTPFMWKFLIIGLLIIAVLITGGIVINGIIDKKPGKDGSNLSNILIASYEATISKLTDELSGITEDNRQLGESLDRAGSRNNELEKINKELRGSLSELNSIKSEYEHEFGELGPTVREMEDTIDNLGDSVGTSRDQADSIGERNREIAELIRIAREQAEKFGNTDTN